MGSSSECPAPFRWECRDKLSGVCGQDCATCPSICVCSALCVSFDICPGPAMREEARRGN